jgi:hypothetical protein
MKEDDTHFDRAVRRIKNRPRIAFLLLVGLGVIVLGDVTGALDSISDFYARHFDQAVSGPKPSPSPEAQDTAQSRLVETDTQSDFSSAADEKPQGIPAGESASNSEVQSEPSAPSPPSDKPMSYPRSCVEARDDTALNLSGSADSGYYLLDPDGEGPASAVRVYCDMETNNGGWLRLAEEVASCGTGKGGTIESLARTEDLNPHGFEFSTIRSNWLRGRSWCSDKASDAGWDCSFNFGIVKVDGDWLYDGRIDPSRNHCRNCSYKEFRIPVQRQSTNFFIVDPENFTDTAEHDNGCTANGVMFSVWIR